ncbi:MAG TPA: tetratricopeptide repeat protein [Pseudolabrys sp.]|nr:tetratricopeptide repeat protein [Pseudolabrys sp.]
MNSDAAKQYFFTGLEHLESGDFANAEKFLAHTLDLAPRSIPTLSNLAIAQYRQKKIVEASETAEKAIEVDPTHKDGYRMLATCQREQMKYEDALATCEKILALDPTDAEALCNRGSVLNRLQKYSEAIQSIDRALAIQPIFADAHLNRGNSLGNLKRYEEALTSYENALALKPNLSEAWLGRGNIFHDLKRYDEALAAYDKAISLKSDLESAWLGRGRVFMAQERDDKASSSYEIFLDLQKRHVQDLQNRTVAKEDAGKMRIFGEIEEWQDLDEILDALRLLAPSRAIGFDKIRLGSAADGGYILLNDFTSIFRALSFGISLDDSWDTVLALKGIPVDQYDHSIEDAPTHHRLLKFSRKKISTLVGENSTTLDDLVAPLRGSGSPDLILKIDIEGDEWDVFDQVTPATLSRFSQIVGEFHQLHRVKEREFLRRTSRVFKKLSDSFSVIHVHGNNFGKVARIAGKMFPDTLELSFASRSRYRFESSSEQFPTILDMANNPFFSDINLGTFRF